MNQNKSETQSEQKQFYMVEAFLPENILQDRVIRYFNERKKDSTKLGKNGIDEHFLMNNGAEIFLFQNYKINEEVNVTIFCHSTPSYHERGLKAIDKVGEIKKQESFESLDGMLTKMGVLKIDRQAPNDRYASFNIPSGTYS